MKRLGLLLIFLTTLPACATVNRAVGRGGEHARAQLWEQAHLAVSGDSVRVAKALFQRLVVEHPRTYEGHESLFYLGVLSLDPRGGVDIGAARQNLSLYLAEPPGRMRGYHYREAASVYALTTELLKPCGARVAGLPCPVDTRVVVREGETAPPPADASAELARLRREVAERDARIRELNEELQRIRNTLAPRRPR
jgi:hypothetical protein